MPLYFLVHDGEWFERRLRPALAASWRQRSFEPCRELCLELVQAVFMFRGSYFIPTEGSLIIEVERGLPFQRDYWRSLVGEVLFFGSADVPDLQTCPETLCRLLAPQTMEAEPIRERFAPIQQVLYGSRDLTFGGGFYRPENVGYNEQTDVDRLAAYLETINPKNWTLELLRSPGQPFSREEAGEEVDFAREWFAPLCDLYRRARERGQVLVCERIGA